MVRLLMWWEDNAGIGKRSFFADEGVSGKRRKLISID